jgi:hypothetical protein
MWGFHARDNWRMEIDDMSPLISRRFEASLIGNREEPNNNGPNGSSGERQLNVRQLVTRLAFQSKAVPIQQSSLAVPSVVRCVLQSSHCECDNAETRLFDVYGAGARMIGSKPWS